MIWIEVKLPNKETLLLMGGYREWSYFKELKIAKSNSLQSQLERLEIMLNSITKAKQTSNQVIIIMDSNLDTSPDNHHNLQHKVEKLMEKFANTIETLNLDIVNKEFTRYVNHQNPSTIDHFITNSTNKKANILTKNVTFSDHCLLQAFYKVKIQNNTQFKKVRDWKLFNQQNIDKYFNINENLNKVFDTENPEISAKILQDELNLILNKLSLARVGSKRAYFI